MIARKPDDGERPTTGEVPAFVNVPPPAIAVPGATELDATLDGVLTPGLAQRFVANGIAERVFTRLDDDDLWYFEREIAEEIARAAGPADGIDAAQATAIAASLIDRGLRQLAARWQEHRVLRRKYERRWSTATDLPSEPA